MSIADKLTLLINTKQDIKSAISEKGVEVTGGMTTYADAIRRIETGGGGGGGEPGKKDPIYVPNGLKFGYGSSDPNRPPDLNLPKIILAWDYTDGSYMFARNTGLWSIEGIYFANPMFPGKPPADPPLTNCSHMFYQCERLLSIPLFDTSNVTDMGHMFEDCKNLETIPKLDTSKVTNMWSTFENCTSLTTIPQLDTSSVTEMTYAFANCSSLKSLPELDFGGMTDSDITYIFGQVNLPTLTDLGGFRGLAVSLYHCLNYLPNLTVQSIMNVIDCLHGYLGGGDYPVRRYLELGPTNLNKLTDEQKAVATNKGWTLI